MPARKVIAVRLSEKERTELQHAFKRESAGRHSKHGHYGFATWLRRVWLNHARQLELELRNTRDRAGAVARISPKVLTGAGEQ